MDDLISRQEAIDALRGERHGLVEFMDYCLKNEMYGARYHAKVERNRIDEDILILENLPTAEPEIIRCKDCRYYNAGFECLIEGYGIERNKEWFCADAERK